MEHASLWEGRDGGELQHIDKTVEMKFFTCVGEQMDWLLMRATREEPDFMIEGPST